MLSFLREFVDVVVLSVPGMVVLGLIGGSFLNVVIHRIPVITERDQWEQASLLMSDPRAWSLAFPDLAAPSVAVDAAAADIQGALAKSGPYTLSQPGSGCPQCSHRIRWYENVPLLSWLWLRRRCSGCGSPISWRYPAVEVAVAMVFAWFAWRLGPVPAAPMWAAVCCALLALAVIDAQTALLPDRLTQALLWAGLVAAVLGWSWVGAPLAVAGAAFGYLVPWLCDVAMRRYLALPAMAAGDFKLLAAIGAWLGQPVLVGAVLVVAIFTALPAALLRLRRDGPTASAAPFGPYLAAPAILVVLVGPAAVYDVLR
ncbi:MAG: A24 family peptidase [Aquabacterium sp.]|jgi:leader peptidase (prepilin peptidase)/N-methyltransferase|nr:A24 family peptidase [Aquabacterium sp.]